MKRRALGLACLLAVTSSSWVLAGHRMSDQIRVRNTVHEYLVRMGAIADGPYHEESMDNKVKELAREVGALPDLTLQVLGHYLRNPEAGFDECTVAYCVDRFGWQEPEVAVRAMVRGLPTRHPDGDRCVAQALARIGPGAFPSLEACASSESSPKAYWCLEALLVPTRGLAPTDEDVGVLNEDARQLDMGSARKRIRALVVRWGAWWEDRKGRLHWNRESGMLEGK